jgi:hypothetical protein
MGDVSWTGMVDGDGGWECRKGVLWKSKILVIRTLSTFGMRQS